MNHFLQRFKQKLRYNPIYRIFFDGLTKINIKITPYYLVLEGLFDKTLPQFETGFDAYEIYFLGSGDMKDIAVIPDQPRDEKDLIQMLNNGQKCLGAKMNNRLAAYTWCDLEECNLEWRRFKLAPDEAYLFDAYTLMDFRGKGIAPFIRYQLYKELSKLNRTKLYSISAYFNKQSINFKKKLNAQFVDLGIYVSVFKKFEFSYILKKY
jgi:hypothetical protein